MTDVQIIFFLTLLAIVILLAFLNMFFRKRKNTKTNINIQDLADLFVKTEIKKLEFVRNKFVVTFKDISLFDVMRLNDTFAKGITVVGDKIKFYVDEDIIVNEKIYKEVKKIIEGA